MDVWRAPTDNDGIKSWTEQDDKPLGRWIALGLDPENLTKAFHTIDLILRKETILRLDVAYRGLGTASCGPDAGDSYRIHSNRFVLDTEWR